MKKFEEYTKFSNPKKENPQIVDITANIKTDNPEDVEEFFDDVKKSYAKITSFDDFDDDEPDNKTGRSYDEDNEEEDIIVQGEAKIVNETIIKKFDHINERAGDFDGEFEELKERVEKLENQFLYLETLIEVGDDTPSIPDNFFKK